MPAPVNDTFAGALALSGTSGTEGFDNTAATLANETGETGDGQHSLWWRLDLGANGGLGWNLHFDTAATPTHLDTVISVCFNAADFTAPAADVSDLTVGWVNDDIDYPTNARSSLDLFANDNSVLYIRVSSYDPRYDPTSGLAETASDGVLTWSFAAVVAAPTITSWTRTSTISVTATRGSSEVWAGEDITVDGTDLDALTSVTIGGGAVPWDVTSPTEIVLHVGTTARTGPIVVTNAGGSYSTEFVLPNPVIRYPGPWLSVSPAGAEILSGWSGKYLSDDVSHGTVESASTQPAWDTVPLTTDSTGFVFARSARSHMTATQSLSYDGAPPEPYTYDWRLEVDVLGLDATPTQYNMPPVTPSSGSWPAHAVNVDSESDHGTATTDPTLYARRATTDGEYKDDLDKDALAYPGGVDMWNQDIELRRITLPAPAYLPDRTALAALPLDYALPGWIPSRAVVTTSDHASSGTTTNYRADLSSSPTTAYEEEIGVVPWTDWTAYTLAWLPVPSRLADDSAVVIPDLGPDHDPGIDTLPPDASVKDLNTTSQVRAAWTYQPPRFRFVYDEPPVASGWQVGSVAW